MKKWTAGIVAMVGACLLLAGCTPSQSKETPSPHLTTVPSPGTTPSLNPQEPLATAATDRVNIAVYAVKAFRASHGCGCKVKKSAAEELFPKGSPVVMLRVAVAGQWSLQHKGPQDVTGMNVNGTKFEGRPELAVLDTTDGKKQAAKANLPWMPEGLFDGEDTWRLQNKTWRSFAVAYYVPAGAGRLLLTVDVPTQSQPVGPAVLRIRLPDGVMAMTRPGSGTSS